MEKAVDLWCAAQWSASTRAAWNSVRVRSAPARSSRHPSSVSVNDAINKRLERSEFMPFAPVVLEERRDDRVRHQSRQRTCGAFHDHHLRVHPEWQTRIPAVVHVDGSARPQIIARADNPLYYDVLAGFHGKTGLPVLVNTSFNVHEEPIVDKPAQALKSLVDGRIDHILTEDGAVFSGCGRFS